MLRFFLNYLLSIALILSAPPATAMFIQSDWLDPTKPGVGTNRYSYSFNDPINNADPNGNQTLLDPIPVIPHDNIIMGGVAVVGSLGIAIGIMGGRPGSIVNLPPYEQRPPLLDQTKVITTPETVDLGDVVRSTGSDILDGVLGGMGGIVGLPGGKSSVPNYEAPGADIEGVLEGLSGQGIELEAKGNGVYVGELPDGTRVVVRPGSKTDGRPTVEVQAEKQSGGMRKASETRLGEHEENDDDEERVEN